MNQAVRVLRQPLSLLPTTVRSVKEQIETFLEASLPADFAVADQDKVQLFGKSQMEELMLEREPFFFIEKAAAVNDNVVYGACTMTRERSAGHFPGRPIVPLIELCKATAQTGIILAALQGDEDEAPIAIKSGPSKALARNLIDAPARVLVKVELTRSHRGLHIVSGLNYVNSVPVGSLKDIWYVLMSRQKLLADPQ